MFERLKFGSYRIDEDSELASNKIKTKSSFLIKFLDSTNVKFNLDVSSSELKINEYDNIDCDLQKKAKGSELLDKVFQHLELTESDYFGLKFCQNESEVSHRGIRGKTFISLFNHETFPH